MKKAKIFNPCHYRTLTQWKFLWWKGTSQNEGDNHEWLYKNREHRVCGRCKKKELLYKVDNFDGYLSEDWRAEL